MARIRKPRRVVVRTAAASMRSNGGSCLTRQRNTTTTTIATSTTALLGWLQLLLLLMVVVVWNNANPVRPSQAFVVIRNRNRTRNQSHARSCFPGCSSSSSSSSLLRASTEEETTTERDPPGSIISMEDLFDMDVVVYSLENSSNSNNDNDDHGEPTTPTLYLGALQEDGILSPLSAWTDEPAFGDAIECLVDDVDRFSLKKESNNSINDANGNGNGDIGIVIRIHHRLSEDEVSYGSRQCPRGPHNPHGEESELLYYVDKSAVLERFGVALPVKPELETLW